MTGREHRAEADHLLVAALTDSQTARAAVLVAAAQVHALLALTADHDT